MEKRAFAAVVLSTLVLVFYQYLAWQAVPPVPVDPQADQVSVGDIASSPSKTLAARETAVSTKGEVSEPIVEQPLEVSLPTETVEEKSFNIDVGPVLLSVSNKGGKITGISLRDYVDNDKKQIKLIKEAWSTHSPLTVRLGGEELSNRVNGALYQFPADLENDIVLSPENPIKKIQFTYNDPAGITVIREYTFRHNDYRVGLELMVDDRKKIFGAIPVKLVWAAGIQSDVDDQYAYTGPTLLVDGELISEPPDDKGVEESYRGNIPWTAFQDKYFVAAIIPESSEGMKGVVKNIGDDQVEVGYEFALSPQAKKFDLYAGPKREGLIREYGVSLESIIDFGWFDSLGKPLYKVLTFFYNYTANYGIAIILITLIIKIIFFPLSQKSFKSMKDMQKLQPYLKVLQERYKDDRQKLNQEMMNLYKEHKVNPLGGCLPMIVQIPVFIALYQVLMNSIELRQAPFFLWIADLSIKDPFYITPILMGVSMFLQQKMNPPPTDPVQAKIMMFLPIFFTVMFLNFPAGLVLYWLVNNCLTIGQQYMVNKTHQE